MSALKDAIMDAKYIDMVSLADFVVRDCGLPDMDDDGTPLPQQNEIAAAIFRWAVKGGTAGVQQTDGSTDTKGNIAPGPGAIAAETAAEGEM